MNKMWCSGRRIVDARRRARAQAGSSPSSIAGGAWRRETVARARSLFIDADLGRHGGVRSRPRSSAEGGGNRGLQLAVQRDVRGAVAAQRG